MKCVILAAGYATRLYPLTESFPKPLLDVGGKTILDWLVDDIDNSGKIDEYIVISNHKYAVHFENWVKSKTQRVLVVDDGTETNEGRLGAVCDIQYAIDKLSVDDDMLVIAGDNVLDFSLTEFIAYAKNKGASSVMRYYEPDTNKLKKCGVVVVDEDDRIVEMTEKSDTPPSHWCCPPFYYYSKEAASLVRTAISDGCATDAPGSFISWLCRKLPVYAMEMPGKRYDIGNLESYQAVKSSYRGISQGGRNA